jgi:hypothetical protein
MDNAARAFAQKIISELEKITHQLSIGPPREERERPINPSNQSNPEAPETPWHVPVISPRPKAKAKANNTDANSFPRWRIVELLGVFGVLVAAGANACLWRDANRNFRADQRPWIRIEFAPNKPPSDSDPGNSYTVSRVETGKLISVDVRIRNSGKTPAVAIEGHFFIQLASLDGMMGFEEGSDVSGITHTNGPGTEETTGASRITTGIIFPDQFTPTTVVRSGYVNGKLEQIPLTPSEMTSLMGSDKPSPKGEGFSNGL